MNPPTLKKIIAALAGIYFLQCAYDPLQWHFVDGVNLVIHEAGHIVFMPFGEFLMIAGGSLFQIIMPAAFAFYFYRQEQFYSAALTLFWVGESALNVSVYAGDAVKRELPLLGGQDSIHDWNYLLDTLGLLNSTAIIAGLIRACGAALIIAAIVWAFKSSSMPSKKSDELFSASS